LDPPYIYNIKGFTARSCNNIFGNEEMDENKQIIAFIGIALVALAALYAYSLYPSQTAPNVGLTLDYNFQSSPPTMTVMIYNNVSKTIDWFDVKLNGSSVYALQGLNIGKDSNYQSIPREIILPDNEYIVWAITLGFTDGMSLTHTRIWSPANFSGYYNQSDGTGISNMGENYQFDIPNNYQDNSWVENLTLP